MKPGWLTIIPYGLQGLFAVAVFITVYHLFRAFSTKRRRWLSGWVLPEPGKGRIPPWIERILRIQPGGASLEARRQLLAGCGIRVQAEAYEACRRMGWVAGAMMTAAGLAYPNWMNSMMSNGAVWVPLIAMVSLIFLGTDRIWLGALQRQRKLRITREIYAITRHLLYYKSSRLNLHTKLTRCVNYTDSIRSELLTLLNQWYQDPDQALRHFKYRLGTEEAGSFVETLQSLRLNDHAAYYELLKDRLLDYKEKLELSQESRKETASYMLFVLAGIPILFTFRVFIYPWVVEGQKLFHSLN